MYSADARFVITGSDDGNVRIWKAKAHDKLGVITARERAALEYRESLKQRWKSDAQVGKISRYAYCYSLLHITHIPKGSASAQVGVQSVQAQTYSSGGSARQGGAQEETHASRREQSKTRAEKGGYCRANLVMLFCDYLFAPKITLHAVI